MAAPGLPWLPGLGQRTRDEARCPLKERPWRPVASRLAQPGWTRAAVDNGEYQRPRPERQARSSEDKRHGTAAGGRRFDRFHLRRPARQRAVFDKGDA
ncbi:MAG: hypothetical protein M0C28_12540 [Candidatus Moduliflexus flocculans]|nr:hypothetical protein [Candidatus Moduliflexus flocculans]